MTRYNLFDEIAKLCQMTKTGEHRYNKMIQSGGLRETHWDYNRGYYDVTVYYMFDYKGRYCCRLWFGTIDDGDYGAWKEFETKEEAVALVEKCRDLLTDMVVCPSEEELNKLLNKIGLHACHE